jgi:AcrR family transcriptional regulator
MATVQPGGRVARRRRRNLEALLQAGQDVMSEKGIDAATMQEIANRADVGAGTVYNYFKSKDELAIAVLEQIMEQLAKRIEDVTSSFADPADVYGYGIRTVLETATGDVRWKQLLYRAEVISDTLYRTMGPYAIRDIENAARSSRFFVEDAGLIWRLTCNAIIGVALEITRGHIPIKAIDETVVRLLCMTGIGIAEARTIAAHKDGAPKA